MSITEKGRFLGAISQKTANTQRQIHHLPVFRSCDMSAMATAVDPSVIVEQQAVYATVEVTGQYTRGMMVLDWRGVLGETSNVKVVKKIDTSRASELFDAIVK